MQFPIKKTSLTEFKFFISSNGFLSNIAKSAGYSITVGKRDSSGNITNTTDFYHFTVDTDTATSGSESGGGENCSAGPATLTA